MLGLAYRQQAKFNEAIAEFKTVGPAFNDDGYVLRYLGKIYAEAGNKQAALRNLSRLHELSSKGYTSPVAAAMIYFGLHTQIADLPSWQKPTRHATPTCFTSKLTLISTLCAQIPGFRN